jgi:hypothetical protein
MSRSYLNRAHRSRGQALTFTLLFAAVGVAALVALFYGGQMIAARTRLTHAADAAAYSGAQAQARTLNFLAYANRAQVAHQVAMAHLVTLNAWQQFGHTQGLQSRRGNPPSGLIGMLFGASYGAAYGAASRDSARNQEHELKQAFAEHDRVVHDVLERVTITALEDAEKMRTQAILSVLRANLPHSSEPRWSPSGLLPSSEPAQSSVGQLHVTLLSDNLQGYLQRYRGNSSLGLRPMTQQAANRYPFLNPRDANRKNGWPVSHRCPLLRHELRRRGSTWLDAQGRWGAADTESFHALRSNKYIGCYYREYAMGWGYVQEGIPSPAVDFQHVDKPPSDFSQQDFWRWVQQSTSWNIHDGSANPLANSYAVRDAVQWRSRGLPSYVDVTARQSNRSLRFALSIWQEGSSKSGATGTHSVRSPRGAFTYTDLRPGEGIRVTSAAETYFDRPVARADRRTEFSHLFRPYWQARRVAVSASEQASAARQKNE